MSVDERTREPKPMPSNVRPLRPRSAESGPKAERDARRDPFGHTRNVVGDDDDPGPSAA
jgi:hypothetical protein